MRKVVLTLSVLALIGVPALAADLQVKAPLRSPVPVWSWTGFYIGGHIAGGWAKSDWFEDPAQSGSGGAAPVGFQDASIHASGFLGGGQIGFDYQTGWAVLGIQADADFAGLKGNVGSCFPELAFLLIKCATDIKSLGTVTGRVGAAFDHWLLYVLGGFAWEREHLDSPCVACASDSVVNRTAHGWTVGTGLEYALTGNWSVFLQYNYMSFGTRDLLFVTTPAAVGNFTENVRDRINVVKAGINYRFNWGPRP
jgi:outer membrane immunogenic protein